jgi:tetratricopeptide (TPR) repeat protein
LTRTSTLSGLLALLSLTLTVIAMVFVVGTLRYGGSGNLMRRLHSEVMAHRPHPDFVPTPLAMANSEAAVSLADSDIFPAAPASDTAAPAQVADQGEPPTPAYRGAAPSVQLTGLSHMWQTWNNCGPATLAMNLSYYGSPLSQADIGAALRLYEDDKNVGPEEMAVFARSQGFNALVRVNGDADRLRLMLSNDVPVLIETWHEPEPNDGMGHYRLLVGYEDATREWIAYDSYDSRGVDPNQPYAGIRVPYDELDRLWSVFNRTYILIYTDELTPAMKGILGEDMDDATMWQRALEHAWAETQERPDDPFAWFNLGSDLVALGQFEPAAAAYDYARRIGLPWRMLWYQFGPFQAYYETGRYQEVLSLTNATIETTSSVEEIYYWQGMALKAQGDIAGARQAWLRALELNPNYAEAAEVSAGLEP